MADITSKIEFTGHQLEVIGEKVRRLDFTFQNWSDEDLKGIRRAIRSFYRKVQRASCAYCRRPISTVSVNNCHIEHIAPKSKYPNFLFEPRNLCVICADCNEIKRHQETINEILDPLKRANQRKEYPRSSTAFKIVHPHFDDYDDHILILGTKYYLDKSKKGAFTILSCGLNRHLHQFGWEREITDDTELMTIMSEYLVEPHGFKRSQMLNKFVKLLLLLQQ